MAKHDRNQLFPKQNVRNWAQGLEQEEPGDKKFCKKSMPK